MRLNPDRHLTKPGDSKLGAVVIAQKNAELWAVCEPCGVVLGWTFNEEGGYWACLDGCQTIYENPLGISTTSVLSLRTDRLPNTSTSVREWVAGWLGRENEGTEFVVTVNSTPLV